MADTIAGRARRIRRSTICALVLLLCATPQAQQPAPDGWVVIPVDEYRALRLKAYPPAHPADPPPVEAALTSIEYELRANGDSATGTARLTADVLKEGWVRVDLPEGLLVRTARLDGRVIPVIEASGPHVLLSKPGRAAITLDVVVALARTADAETLTLPPSRAAVSRLALLIDRQELDVRVSGGVLAARSQAPAEAWVAYADGGKPLVVTWKRRAGQRASLPLRWQAMVIEHVGLGEDTSSIATTIDVDAFQGAASSITVAMPQGVAINQVSGPLVADWDARPGVLTVTFVEPLSGTTTISITGEARLARDGVVDVPLLRLPGAEREAGGVAVEVLGAGEIANRQLRGMEAADPSELKGPVAGRDSPSMLAFRFRPLPGSEARGLSVNVARYTAQPVLIANVEEARYEALIEEEGKTLVRARYAVRNNQRSLMGVRLPEGATLWSAGVGNRRLRPGVGPDGSLLLPLEKGRFGDETPPFVVELTYVHRSAPWAEKGDAALPLPAVDLPIARTGVVLHYSPRFRITPEPGPFRVETDNGPFTLALRNPGTGTDPAGPPPPPAAPALELPGAPAADDPSAALRKDFTGRTVTGPLPVHIPFPEFGPTVFLMAELTAEMHAPSIELSYKRETRW